MKTKQTGIMIDCFSSGLDDLPRAKQKDVFSVLQVLDKCKRFSVFEATANDDIARMMTRLMHKGYSVISADGSKKEYGMLIKDVGGAYPWTNVEITDGGRRLLDEGVV